MISKNLLICLLLQNKKNMFKVELELFCHETKRIEPTNEDQEKELEKREPVLDTASNLYNNLLEVRRKRSNEEEVTEGKGLKILTPNKILTSIISSNKSLK